MLFVLCICILICVYEFIGYAFAFVFLFVFLHVFKEKNCCMVAGDGEQEGQHCPTSS